MAPLRVAGGKFQYAVVGFVCKEPGIYGYELEWKKRYPAEIDNSMRRADKYQDISTGESHPSLPTKGYRLR
jgi:hypothetical protein